MLASLLCFSICNQSIIAIAAEEKSMSVTYAVHIQTYEDSQGWVADGAMAGTEGESKRLEAISIKLEGDEYAGGIVYKTHCQSYGWLDWVADGESSGTKGQSKRLEGIQIYLTGEVAQHYDVVYRVHAQTYGWMDWVSNGTMAGTSGESKRLEAIEIKLVRKDNVKQMGISYRTHCQTYGWLDWTSNGVENGTTGQGKRLEAIEIKLIGNEYGGGIQYKTHIQTYGWEDKLMSNGALSGTSGQSKRLEAIQIELYGSIAEEYSVYYRVHVQGYGWQDWKKDGEIAGTSGESKRLEAIEIKLVKKENIITQYSDVSGNQSMFYTIETKSGELIVIDGGWKANSESVRDVISKHNNHVDAWIITHHHPDHIGAFNEIYANPNGVTIDKIYTTDMDYQLYKDNAKWWDEFEVYDTYVQQTSGDDRVTFLHRGDNINICGLNVDVYNAFDDSLIDCTKDYENMGSLVFEIHGEEESMLFFSDVCGETVTQKVMDECGDKLKSTYVQVGHHGNGIIVDGFYELVSPKIAFMDAPKWLAEGDNYKTKINIEYAQSLGIEVMTFESAPNSIVLR